MGDYEFTMSLGVRHPHMDPARITRALGLQPQHVWRRGDDRRDQAGAALGGAHRDSYWICDFTQAEELSGERTGVESELARILDTLRKAITFMQELQHGGGAVELFISIFARSDFRIELLAEEAALLGRLGVNLAIEIKPHPTSRT